MYQCQREDNMRPWSVTWIICLTDIGHCTLRFKAFPLSHDDFREYFLSSVFRDIQKGIEVWLCDGGEAVSRSEQTGLVTPGQPAAEVCRTCVRDAWWDTWQLSGCLPGIIMWQQTDWHLEVMLIMLRENPGQGWSPSWCSEQEISPSLFCNCFPNVMLIVRFSQC